MKHTIAILLIALAIPALASKERRTSSGRMAEKAEHVKFVIDTDAETAATVADLTAANTVAQLRAVMIAYVTAQGEARKKANKPKRPKKQKK